jgi:hypothetical protein
MAQPSAIYAWIVGKVIHPQISRISKFAVFNQIKGFVQFWIFSQEIIQHVVVTLSNQKETS